jgi:hypothetical protein
MHSSLNPLLDTAAKGRVEEAAFRPHCSCPFLEEACTSPANQDQDC